MSETTNYKLHLTDDSAERFYDWRIKMNGPEDSNMVKIDTALGEKADSSVSVPGVLRADEWVDGGASFTQELVVEGLGAEQNGSIALGDVTPEQMTAACDAFLTVTGQKAEKLIVSAYGKRPALDIPVTTILLG